MPRSSCASSTTSASKADAPKKTCQPYTPNTDWFFATCIVTKNQPLK